jgi:uncharacterized protein
MTKNSGPESRVRRTGLLPKPKLAAIALVAIVYFFLPAGVNPAQAQFDPWGWMEHFGDFFRQKPPPGRVAKPKQEIHRAAPESRWERSRPSYDRPYRGSRRPAEQAAERAKSKAPAVAPAYFVAVLGDSLAQMLGQGLSEAFDNRPEVAILRKAKEDSGLVRDDFFDWVKATTELLDSGQKIDFAVMMIGSNDRQALRDTNGSYEPRSPEWQAAYTQRIETIAAMFRDKKIPLIWVGLPIFKSESLSADALAFNEFYRAYSEKAGAKYIDIWEAFADEAGHFSATGPDINGQNARLRASDGVHFTKAGARKLANFVEPEIRRNLEEVLPKSEPDATPELANLPSSANGGKPSNVPASPESGVLPAPKPVAGPVLSLMAPPLAPRGNLATPSTAGRITDNDAQILIEQTLQEGKPLAPKPGRADDFSWPRN